MGGYTEYTGHKRRVALYIKWTVRCPHNKLALLPGSARLRAAVLLVPHHNAAPYPPRPLYRVGQCSKLPPVGENRRNAAGLCAFTGEGKPFGRPTDPRPLIEIVTRERMLCVICGYFAGGQILIPRTSRTIAPILPAAAVRRVGNHRVHRVWRYLSENVQRIAVYQGVRFYAQVFYLLFHGERRFV